MPDPTQTTEALEALLSVAPKGPWEWSVYAGRHKARLCTEEQLQSGEGWILQLDRDKVPSVVAELTALAPELAAEVVWLRKALRAAERERDEARDAERARCAGWLRAAAAAWADDPDAVVMREELADLLDIIESGEPLGVPQ